MRRRMTPGAAGRPPVGRLTRHRARAAGEAARAPEGLESVLGTRRLDPKLDTASADPVRDAVAELLAGGARAHSVAAGSRDELDAAGRIRPEAGWAELLTGGDVARALEAVQARVRLADRQAQRQAEIARTAAAGVQELLAGLATIEEGVRAQFAAELHDGVAQSLAAARALLAADPADLSGQMRLSGLRDYLEDAEAQLRAVISRARPPALDGGDLGRAVSELRADMAHRYGLEVQVSWPRVPRRLPVTTAVAVYRFFQEGLVNIVKHADVEQAWLSLDMDETGLVARVRDAGVGFSAAEASPREGGRHVGLELLATRARLAGGHLTVSSGPGGTVLTLQLPVPTPG